MVEVEGNGTAHGKKEEIISSQSLLLSP